jgi:hypothetical protein
MRRIIVLISASILLIASTASAQKGVADIGGRVVDQQGNAVPGVAVVLRNQESGIYREAVSATDGSFLFSAIDPAVYEVSGELSGFKKFLRRDVRVVVGQTADVEVKLEIGSVAETVTVTGESPLVDTTSQEIGGRVGAQEFVDIPSFNRNFAGYLGQMPGVVATISLTTFGADSISVAGQNIRNVNYALDGSNNNDTFNGGNGGAQARMPVEAVQEFQLLTSQFDAKFGLASGGVVNAVSKQGTNQFHGSGFAFSTNEKLTSLDYFAEKQGLEKAPSQQQQFGGTLGGPIIRNKAHFFGSIERVLLDNGQTVNIPTRPEFNRTDFEITRVWNYFGRFDHQLASNHTWGLRYLREDSPQPIQLLDNWTIPDRNEAETDTDWTFVGNLSSVLGSSKVNTFRVAAVTEDVFFGNPNFNTNGHNQKILLPTLVYQSFSTQQSARANRRLDVAYSADDVFSWYLPNRGGDHDIKLGVNYLYSTLRVENYGNQNGTFTFPNDLSFDPANPRTYPERFSIRVPGALNYMMQGHFIGVFAQDKWRLNRRLTVNVGLRYDLEILPTRNAENPLFAGDPAGYPKDKNNVAPRTGFAYALDDRSAIRGGFGVFFQRTSYTFLTPTFDAGRNSVSFTQQFPTNNADAGPRAGNFPTNEMLRNGPVVNHALIDAMFPPGTRARNTGTVNFDNPDRQVPWSRQYSIGYERQFGADMAMTVDYIRSEQRSQYMSKELNPGLRDTTTATSTLRRLNPLVGAVGEFAASVQTPINVGWIDYNSVQFSLMKRYRQNYSARVSYAYSRGRGISATGQNDAITSQLLSDLRLDQLIGPTAVDRPHILSLNGTYDVPRTGGLKISGVFQARTGTPFSLINTTFDLDRNGSTANEFLPAGTYSGAGEDAITVENEGGRNGARGPGYMSLDVRAGYRFRMPGSRTLDALIDVFNLTNHANFQTPTGDQRQALFLRLTAIAATPTRTVQLNLRYGF